MEYNLLGESFYCALATNHPENKETKMKIETKHKINDEFNGSTVVLYTYYIYVDCMQFQVVSMWKTFQLQQTKSVRKKLL